MAVICHLCAFASIFDIYFRSPIVNGESPSLLSLRETKAVRTSTPKLTERRSWVHGGLRDYHL
jgi:hypothetical protein